MKKYLVMMNMSHQFDWDAGQVNRNYHVLHAIHQSGHFNKILSIDFIPFTKKKVLKVLLKAQPWRRTKNTVFKKMSTRVDKDREDGNFFHMTSIDLRDLRVVLKELGFPEDDLLLWVYNPLIAAILDEFPKSFVVFDAVDNWLEHPSYANHKELLEKAYNEIRKRADAIFTVSESLIDFFGKKEKVFYIPNGVNAKHFDNARCSTVFHGSQVFSNLNTTNIKTDHRPVIGYHGVIQERVNLKVFDYLASKHPEYDFVIAGPVWKEVKEGIDHLRSKENVHVLGAVPYNELPSLIACFDVGIIPHNVDTLTHSMNPLKIYEYLAAGKPIVSTAISGAEQFQDLIKLAVSPEDFSKKITQLIKNDSEELRKRRKAMARTHSWSKRLQVMFESIEKIELQKEGDNGSE